MGQHNFTVPIIQPDNSAHINNNIGLFSIDHLTIALSEKMIQKHVWGIARVHGLHHSDLIIIAALFWLTEKMDV